MFINATKNTLSSLSIQNVFKNMIKKHFIQNNIIYIHITRQICEIVNFMKPTKKLSVS